MEYAPNPVIFAHLRNAVAPVNCLEREATILEFLEFLNRIGSNNDPASRSFLLSLMDEFRDKLFSRTGDFGGRLSDNQKRQHWSSNPRILPQLWCQVTAAVAPKRLLSSDALEDEVLKELDKAKRQRVGKANIQVEDQSLTIVVLDTEQ
ncbi:hypothetical protein E8E11_002692 [Didymella keratinophila]|nr:hypothetical protein E8E11_002692 [Didymella keratinophila]